MSHKQLHPEIEAFKNYVNTDPVLIREIRKSGKPLQSYYERWSTNKDDPLRDTYKKSESKTLEAEPKKGNNELLDQILNLTKYIDLNKVQEYVDQFNQTIQTIQLMLGEIKEKGSENKRSEKQTRPFNLFRD